jgi:glycosyltransferase involved in cell wall biosynthesis
MKIIIISQYFWPENFLINDIAFSLKDYDIEVEILTGYPNYPEGEIFTGYSNHKFFIDKKLNLKIYRVPIISRGKNSLIKLVLNYMSFIISSFIFGLFIIKRNKYDRVLVYGLSPILQALPALLICKLRSIKTILYVQDLWPESLVATNYINNKIIINILEKIVSYLYRKFDTIIVSSKPFISIIKKHNKNVSYIPNSIDSSFNNNKNINKIYENIDSKKFNIIFAGNLGKAQSLDVIIDIAIGLKKYKDIEFIIVGAGSSLDTFNKKILESNLNNIKCIGRYEIEFMKSILDYASILLVTLSNNKIVSKTLPSKIQTYLYMGKPIVACLDGEAARVITESKSGIVVKSCDSASAIIAIKYMYNLNPEARKLYGINGRNYFDINFDRNIIISKLAIVIKS